VSDKVGRRPVLVTFGVLGTLSTLPILTELATVRDAATAFLLIVAGLAIVSCYTAINAVVKAELFPTSVRALGVGLPYAITVALFGGTAEWIALWLKQAGHETYFYWYVSGCIAVSLIVYATMRDTRDDSEIEKSGG
jgi:MHS family alpha-ketoglutarate permease-like MFS transporter